MGKTLSLTTRQKISLSKTVHTIDSLMSRAAEYVESIVNAKPEEKKVPSIVGFCLHTGISRSRLYELAQANTEVADIVEYIGMLQEELALSGGLTNRTNPIFSMFLLKSKHGYQDTPANMNQYNTFNISPELLADAFALMRSKKGAQLAPPK
jgi:hypothetical protein